MTLDLATAASTLGAAASVAAIGFIRAYNSRVARPGKSSVATPPAPPNRVDQLRAEIPPLLKKVGEAGQSADSLAPPIYASVAVTATMTALVVQNVSRSAPIQTKWACYLGIGAFVLSSFGSLVLAGRAAFHREPIESPNVAAMDEAMLAAVFTEAFNRRKQLVRASVIRTVILIVLFAVVLTSLILIVIGQLHAGEASTNARLVQFIRNFC